MSEVCASCRFWAPPPPDQGMMGQCRRRPPVPFMVLSQAPQAVSRLATPNQPQAVQVIPQFVSAWPPSPANGGCGEYEEEPKRSVPPAADT